METQLILLRGNSGSGKTTIAQLLRAKLPAESTLLLSQDTLRREMLGVKDHVDNPTSALLWDLLCFGDGRFATIIVEGIFKKEVYEKILAQIAQHFAGRYHAYYFQLTLAETFQRHQTRSQKTEFGLEELTRWYQAEDTLDFLAETLLLPQQTRQAIVEQILMDLI